VYLLEGSCYNRDMKTLTLLAIATVLCGCAPKPASPNDELRVSRELIVDTKMVVRDAEHLDIVGVMSKTTSDGVIACMMYYFKGEDGTRTLGYSLLIDKDGKKKFGMDEREFFLTYCKDDGSLKMQKSLSPFKP